MRYIICLKIIILKLKITSVKRYLEDQTYDLYKAYTVYDYETIENKHKNSRNTHYCLLQLEKKLIMYNLRKKRNE